MARRPSLTQTKKLYALLEPYGKQISDAFFASVNDIVSQADVPAVIRALEAGDYDAAVDALHISAAAFGDLDPLTHATYNAGGNLVAGTIPPIPQPNGTKVIIRFDPRNPVAAAWADQHAGNLISSITNDQLLMVRNHVREALMAGRSPRDIALDLVGRIDRRTGARSGGVLGLTDFQAQLVRNAQNQLTAGGSAELRAYLTRELRDKRFDLQIIKALNNKTAVPVDVIERAMLALKNNMLRARGESIGRTESIATLNAARKETFRQAVASGSVRQEQVRRTWNTASDNRVRDSHETMHGQTVGLDEPFVTGNGVQLMYPGDPSAPADEVINCRCDVNMRIDFLANIRPGDA